MLWMGTKVEHGHSFTQEIAGKDVPRSTPITETAKSPTPGGDISGVSPGVNRKGATQGGIRETPRRLAQRSSAYEAG